MTADLHKLLDESSTPSTSLTPEPVRLEELDTKNTTNATTALISSSEEHLEQRDLHSKRVHQIVEQVLPLPKPIQALVSHVLIRLVGDMKELLEFARRQLDAVVGVLRGRIGKERMPASDTAASNAVADPDSEASAL